MQVKVIKYYFQLEYYEIGSGDFLFIYDGNTTDAELVRLYKGYSYGGGEVIESSGRYLFIRYSVDREYVGAGWTGTLSGGDETINPPDVDPPSIPTGLLAPDVNVTSMKISWNPSTDNRAVSGYTVYVDGKRKDATTTTSYNLTQLTANTTYNITVSAFDAASNESAQSIILTQRTLENDLVAPSTPEGLQTLGVTGNTIQLAWNPAMDNVNVSGYNIYVNGEYRGSIATNSFTITGLNANTTYSITVSAYDEVDNESSQSVPLSVTTGAPDNEPPSIPTGLNAINVTSNTISLVWNPSTDNVIVQGYHIISNGILIGTAFSNSFTLTQLSPGISYDITVSAFDASSNESEKSEKITVKTVNPDKTLNPTMPVVATRKTTTGTDVVTVESRLDSLGHTDLEDYGVVFSRDLATLEFQPATYGDREKDTVVHEERVKENLLVLYDFSEQSGNRVMDISGNTPPLDLTINLPRDVYWQPGQGLKVTGNQSMIYSDEIPTKLIDRISSSNEITMEAWIKPSKLNQIGPARIMTLSTGNDSRAFMLGMEGSVSDFDYAVRLKTEGTEGINGLPQVQTNQGFFSLGLHHLVYTRDKQGNEKIWVNNKLKYSGIRTGDLSFSSDNKFALANEWTLQRPWNGTIYLVAVYSRALSKSEINDNFLAGFGELRFTVELDTLQTNTAYYISPFVRTDQGVVYGDVKQINLKNVLHFQGSDSLEMAVVPNPSDGSFTLSFEDVNNEEPTAIFRIADVSGHVLFTDTIDLEGNLKSHVKSYNLNSILRSGIYSVILILGSNSKAQRLIIYPR